MAKTLVQLRADVQRQLNDESATFWSGDEIDRYLRQAYEELARTTRCVWDLRYLENLPAGFSITAEWERAYAVFVYGIANYTLDDERRLMTETERMGPANHTSPFEATDLWLSSAGASTTIPATAELPDTVHAIDRATWDDKAVPTMRPVDAARWDSRYQLTAGEVEALIMKDDGINTVRKMRVPAAQAQCYTVNGSWGILRSPTAISSSTVSGTWGCPRQVPGLHPMGSEHWGLPRRPYQDRTNVRVEHWREGRDVSVADDVFEIPDRATVYLRHAAIARCYARSGPAQDLRLAKHYNTRWQRGLERLTRRVQAQQRGRVGQLGGRSFIGRSGPPRPKLPWQFGQELRS